MANFGKEGTPEPIVTKISQETLADMIGTTRSRVSHFVNKFRHLQLIEYSDDKWTRQLVTVTCPGLFDYGLTLHRFMRKVQIEKNPTVASVMTEVASHPITSIGRGRVSRPIMRGF